MEEPTNENPLTKLWRKVGQNALMINQLNEFLKLMDVAITAILSSMDDERTFSTLGYMKSKLCNRLGCYLDTCVKTFS
jgi:hypothetical protein